MRLKSLFSRFQSTLPREERLNASTTLQHCDIISIHAPTRGATAALPLRLLHLEKISIHAPTRGATVQRLDSIKFYRISIHAPTRGATPKTHFTCSALIFQSTLPREERLFSVFSDPPSV